MISISMLLDVCSQEAVAQALGATRQESIQKNKRSFLQYPEELVQRLFNYGMHAGGDRELVKHCLLELFWLIRDQPERLRIGISVDSNIFRMFRQLLIRQMTPCRSDATPETLKDLFPSEKSDMIRKPTGLQRELVFLKFHCYLSYSEVAAIMGFTVEKVRSEISKSIDSLVPVKIR